MKTLQRKLTTPHRHWVGNGFPVRSLFSYHGDTKAISPFLLLDYAGPHDFEPNEGAPRGVGEHPHRGFETVTIVYDGEVSHRDSGGGGGTIGPGEVQWMTAGSGVVHEEFHSEHYSKQGGPFRMVQLWVNLPAADKMTPGRYQALTRDSIPVVETEHGPVRVIAGDFNGESGPAETFTPINVYDMSLKAGAELTLDLPEGHNSLLVVMEGELAVADDTLKAAEVGQFSVEGEGINIQAKADTKLLVLTGEPIDEPVVGHGPFVMNSREEIEQAMRDYRDGRFGNLMA